LSHACSLDDDGDAPRGALANLAGPFELTGAGTAFSFIPIAIAVLADVRQYESGLASGLMNTSIQLGAAPGIAIASGVAAS
jgi:hypothetical protein